MFEKNNVRCKNFVLRVFLFNAICLYFRHTTAMLYSFCLYKVCGTFCMSRVFSISSFFSFKGIQIIQLNYPLPSLALGGRKKKVFYPKIFLCDFYFSLFPPLFRPFSFLGGYYLLSQCAKKVYKSQVLDKLEIKKLSNVFYSIEKNFMEE